jgi:hypothetical protein
MVVPIVHHGEMIADLERLRTYKAAIDQVIKSDDFVVDVGSGLGPLALLAAQRTAAPVVAIEYLPDVAAMSKQLLEPRIKVLSGRSYDITFESAPDVVVTETIGPVGPEENLVEIMFDLKRRYPDIRAMIPYSMKMFAQPGCSQKARDVFKNTKDQFRRCKPLGLCFAPLDSKMDRHYSMAIYQDDLSDIAWVGAREKIVSYVLGETSQSAFSATLDLPKNDDWNVVVLTFCAHLADGIVLENSPSSPLTHWYHSYIYRPGKETTVSITYCDETMTFSINWGEGDRL